MRRAELRNDHELWLIGDDACDPFKRCKLCSPDVDLYETNALASWHQAIEWYHVYVESIGARCQERLPPSKRTGAQDAFNKKLPTLPTSSLCLKFAF
jgi:hypothetical protein